MPNGAKPAASHLVDFEPPIYNVWKQLEKTAGSSHYGNSEVRWVDNLLYLYTQPFDIVIDPFAGDGSTIDTCKKRFRRYWVGVARQPEVEDFAVPRFPGVLIHPAQPLAHGALAHRKKFGELFLFLLALGFRRHMVDGARHVALIFLGKLQAVLGVALHRKRHNFRIAGGLSNRRWNPLRSNLLVCGPAIPAVNQNFVLVSMGGRTLGSSAYF